MPAAEHCKAVRVMLDRQAAHSLYLSVSIPLVGLSVFGGLPRDSQNAAKCEIDSGAVAVKYHCSAISCVVVSSLCGVSQCNDTTALLSMCPSCFVSGGAPTLVLRATKAP